MVIMSSLSVICDQYPDLISKSVHHTRCLPDVICLKSTMFIYSTQSLGLTIRTNNYPPALGTQINMADLSTTFTSTCRITKSFYVLHVMHITI